MRLPNKNKYPKELHFNEETYTVKFVARIPGGTKADKGLCDGSTNTIFIRKSLDKSSMFRTFIHECIHAMEFEYEIPIPHPMVHQLEKAIGDFFMINF
jgi:hypothetical protein